MAGGVQGGAGLEAPPWKKAVEPAGSAILPGARLRHFNLLLIITNSAAVLFYHPLQVWSRCHFRRRSQPG